MDLRQIILSRIVNRGMTINDLVTVAQQMGVLECHPRSVYRWLNGQNDIRGRCVGGLLIAAGLTVQPVEPAPVVQPEEQPGFVPATA
jgi:hypothetical protein